jgi:gluconate 5-dehydrogenase
MDLKDMFDLSGKVALITGGNGYLGSSMSEALAEYNATVILASRDINKNIKIANELTNKYHNINVPAYMDLSNEDSVKECINKTTKEYSTIDILINNANFGAGGKMHEMPFENWKCCLQGSIDGVFLCTKTVLLQMMRQQGGSIINIGSMYGVVPPHICVYDTPCEKNYSPVGYGVGKAGIIHLTKYIASVYSEYGIRCNCISPGPFPNPSVQQDKDFIKRLCGQNPMGRIGQPDDLKGIILLLASNASSYITGQNILVDGGWTTW